MPKLKLAAALAVFMAVGSARADVLESVPADTLVAVKIANLTKTNQKVAKLLAAFGVDAFAPDAKDPLAKAKREAHIEKGLNEAGEVGVAFVSPKATGLPPEKSTLILVPVSSYADFLTNFPDAKTEGGITEIDRGGQAKVPFPSTFIADWNGYAVLASDKALLAKPASTLKIAGLAAKESARQDLVLYANFAKLSPEVLPDLDKALGEVTKEIDKNAEPEFAKYKPLVKVTVKQLFAAGRTFLDNADSATVGLNISEAGLNFTVLSNFKPDSYLGQFAASYKGTDAPLTTGLPVLKYFAYGGSVNQPAEAKKVFDDLAQPIIFELVKVAESDTVNKLVTSFHDAIGATKGSVYCTPAPTKVGQEPLVQQVTIVRDGGAEWNTFLDQGTDLAAKLIETVKVQPGQPQPTFEKKTAVKSVEGVSFDSFKFAVKPPEGDAQAAQAQQMMNMVFGSDGMLYDYGVSGKDFVLSSGTTDATLSTILKSYKAGDDALAKLDHVKVVAAELPKVRLMEYYVQVDEIVNTGISTAGQFGLPIQVQLPPDLPPFGFTLGTEESSIRMDAHIPTTTISALISAGFQIYSQFNGGGGNL